MMPSCSHRILTFCLTGLIAVAAFSAQQSFAAGVTYSVAGTNPFPVLSATSRLITADFNSDGKLDIIYQNGSTSGSGISVQLGNGDGTFQTAIAKPTGNTSPFTSGPFKDINFTIITTTEIYFADLNADGKVDMIDNLGGSAVPLVYLNNGTGFTATTSPLPAQATTGRLALGDFNNDGYVDMLNQSSSTAGAGFALYLNTPATPGTFTTITQPASGSFPSGPLSGIAFSSILTNSTIFVVDLNGDGFSDLVLDPGSAVPTVYQNNGLTGSSAAFTSVTSPFASQPAGRFIFGDFNGDGFVDCLNTTSTTNGTGISVYLNNGTGSIAFTSIAMPTNANFTSGPFNGITFSVIGTNNFIVGDFNGDSMIGLVDSPVSSSRYITPQFSAPQITSSTPAKNATGVGVSAPIVLNFNKNVTAGSGSIRIRKTSDNSVVQTIAAGSAAVSGSGTSTITITPPTPLAGATGYYLTFDLTAFLDANGVGLGLSSGITRVAITKPTFLAFTTGSASTAPTVTTPTSASITGTAATLGGNVTSDGGATITEIGVVYSPTATNPSPAIGGSGVIKVVGSGTTGVFTVSASSLTPGTGYTYAAYATNSVGTSYTSFGTFTTLNNNASLSALTLSQGTLSPSFTSGNAVYSASVANTVSSLFVTATAADNNATVSINGSASTVGTASRTIPLTVGSNVITTVVTAQDGITVLTYTTTVIRAAAIPTVTTPTSTSITGTAATLGGNVTSDGGASITEIGVVYAPTATNPSPAIGAPGVIKVNGIGTTGVFTVSATLTPGTAYTYAAYATNSVGTSYTSFGTFTALSSSNASLSALTLSQGTLTPTFASITTNYAASVANSVTSLNVTATTADANATVRINGSPFTLGTAIQTINLSVGSNTVTTVVKAQDGTTMLTYTVFITRAAALPTVTTPTSTSITGTAATLSGNVTSDGGATITEIGVVYSPTTTNLSPAIDGPGVIKVVGSGTTGIFTVSATLTPGTSYTYAAYATNSAGTGYTSFGTFTALKNNANLSALVLSAGTLSPTFVSSTTGYTALVLKASSSITATPTAADADATLQVRVNSGSYSGVTSGTASGSLALNLGSNTIDVLVTAQDGTTTKTYTTTVTRRSSLESWRDQYFGTIANSGNAADTANPANDGLPNLIKFVTGLDPTKNEHPADRIAVNGNNLEFTYPRRIDAMDEVTILVEWSDSLQSNDWHTNGLTETILSSTAIMQQVKVSIDVTGLPRRFMRLRVTDP